MTRKTTRISSAAAAWVRQAGLIAGLLVMPLAGWAQQDNAVDVGQSVPDAKAVAEGLFPETQCEELKAAGFKCMGFKPSMRYSLPATSFKLGSAELPDTLKRQLEVFADVLRARRGAGKVVRIEGHADASGSAEANQVLSQRRAEAVRDFLVEKGADPAMLAPVGVGANMLKNAKDPFSAENRRVEIGRADAPR
jgi:outer membrane protein OmpA-like peptidoglycan-associated protein